jgi:hypothetical protein
VALWEDHLLPMLTRKDGARLECTCKALSSVVREHFKDVGMIKSGNLKRALTTFPRARTMVLDRFNTLPAVVEWLCEGRGRYLERLTSKVAGTSANKLIHEALKRGALPLLKRVEASLNEPCERALLTEGLVAGMQELGLSIGCTPDQAKMVPQLAALGLVRQLPALVKLDISLMNDCGDIALQWPPFLPPSLKALYIDLFEEENRVVHESFLCALPGMLGASGARLERFEINIPSDFAALGDGLLHLAQTLRCCSPTLKVFLFGTSDYFLRVLKEAQNHGSQMERLRVQWADVLAAVSACRELRVLALPHIDVEPLFPAGTAFGRLTNLEISLFDVEISDQERERWRDAGVVGLWELMASGGLPALTKLSARFEGQWGGGGGGEDACGAGAGGRGRDPHAPQSRQASI